MPLYHFMTAWPAGSHDRTATGRYHKRRTDLLKLAQEKIPRN